VVTASCAVIIPPGFSVLDRFAFQKKCETFTENSGPDLQMVVLPGTQKAGEQSFTRLEFVEKTSER
jgi:hypothetical protein